MRIDCLESSFMFKQTLIISHLSVNKILLHKLSSFFNPKITDHWKIFNYLLLKFRKFSIRGTLKIPNLKNAENFQFGKFQKLPIWKILKNFWLRKVQKCPMWKISKMSNLENWKFQNIKFNKLSYISCVQII